MRVTSSMYYKNIQAESSRANERLFDVNKQISSGLKIQYAGDNVGTFTETMRLDNELTSLGQIVKSSESGYKMSNQADTVLNDFETSMERMKDLLVQAASSAQSASSLDAVSAELRGLESHLKNLANTSINGQYIFSGSSIDIKPIGADGVYKGNDIAMNAFVGAGVQEQYNLTGADLFLGEEILVKRQVTTNVPQYNLSAKYPDFTDPTSIDNGTDKIITVNDTIRDLMGDIDDVSNTASHFYLRGVTSDGTSFNKHIEMNDSETVDELLTQIGNAYGNTNHLKVVNVSLNTLGEIVVEDKMTGSSKLEFHLVGAVDYDLTNNIDAANIADSYYGAKAGDIDNLSAGETNFDKIIYGTSSAENSKLYVKNFVQSDFSVVSGKPSLINAQYTQNTNINATDVYSLTIDNGDGTSTSYNETADNLQIALEATGDFTVTRDDAAGVFQIETTVDGVAKGLLISSNLVNITTPAKTITSNILNSSVPISNDALVYDRTQFTKDGSKLSSSTPQIIRGTNAFATPSTKISEVADLSQGVSGTLSTTKLTLSGTNVNGTAYNAEISFESTASGGSTFSLDGGLTNYDIFNMSNPREAVDADKMTYQQLMDVTNMIVSGKLPLSNNASGDKIQEAIDYDAAINSAKNSSNTYLSYDGKIQFQDLNNSDTQATLAIYDSNSGDFSAGVSASVMTFNSNNALTVRDPKTDFFKELNTIITAVEDHKLHPDASSGDARSIGIQNSISMIDDLMEHVSRTHSLVGAQSNSLTNSWERSQLLQISTMTLRSSVIDTDKAEAYLTLTQLSLSYQAMLSTVAKVSQLSLVNYL